MRRWIELAAHLYPRKWQERYGTEFRALLSEVNPGWRELWNVLGGALKMRLTTGAIYLKLGIGIAVTGAIIALAASFAVPRQYVSSAVMRIGPLSDSTTGQGAAAEQPILSVTQDVVSRSSLAEIIQRPELNLYRGERLRKPLEDVISRMQGDIKITVVPSAAATLITVRFAHPDQRKAQAVVNALLSRLRESLASRLLTNAQGRGALHVHQTLKILYPASLPANPIQPNRAAFAAAGLGLGLLLGIAAALVIRQPRRTLLLTAFGILGCILGAAVSFRLPARYVSTAVIRFVPSDKLAGADGAERLRKSVAKIRSRTSLAELIQRPELDLYGSERSNTSLERVIQSLRDRDLKISFLASGPVNGLPATVAAISFEYQDPYQAQAMVKAVILKLIEQNRAVAQAPQYPGKIEVLDNASLSQEPIYPNRITTSAMGFAAGLMLGALVLLLARRRQFQVLA